MFPKGLVPELCGADKPDSAAKALAAFCRTQLRGALFHRTQRPEPLTTHDLKCIGDLRGIVEYEFKAPLASEGTIVPLSGGGFSVSVARSERSRRARYTLAHEIAHTFFYDLNCKPPERLTPYNPSKTATEEARRATRLEERFCDAFAEELLFPWEAAKDELQTCTQIRDPAELLVFIEDVSRRWSVSVELALRRLNRAYGMGGNRDTVVGVIRWRPNAKTGREPSMRVTQSFPRPSVDWFVPTNTRASSVGLYGADFLFDWWQRFEDREPGRSYKRWGVFSLTTDREGKRTVLENEPSVAPPCVETLHLWRRNLEGPKWRRVSLDAPVTYRFYAANPTEAYLVALINLSQARSSARSANANGLISGPGA